MSNPHVLQAPGPFQAAQLRSGDPYELSNGHPIECTPSGGRNSRANLVGGLALGTDPAVESAGFDTGFSPKPGMLRAPDLAIGNVPDVAGWVDGVPPLALEYADTGQDEAELTRKIADLLGAGTQQVWVIRLVGPHRVEVHRPGQPVRIATPGEQLTAPGLLRNPVPVEALYDASAAEAVALRNLLQRRGYDGLEAVRDEGLAQGLEQGLEQGKALGQRAGELAALRAAIRIVLEGRGLALSAVAAARIDACVDQARLNDWLRRAATIGEGEALMAD